MRSTKLLAFLCLLFIFQMPGWGQSANDLKNIIATTDAPLDLKTVEVPESAAPPEWAIQFMTTAESVPVIGPFISKALLYLGIVSSILTALAAFLMTSMNALAGAFHWAGMKNWVEKIINFENGKIMYWIKFFSIFNAKKFPGKIT